MWGGSRMRGRCLSSCHLLLNCHCFKKSPYLLDQECCYHCCYNYHDHHCCCCRRHHLRQEAMEPGPQQWCQRWQQWIIIHKMLPFPFHCTDDMMMMMMMMMMMTESWWQLTRMQRAPSPLAARWGVTEEKRWGMTSFFHLSLLLFIINDTLPEAIIMISTFAPSWFLCKWCMGFNILGKVPLLDVLSWVLPSGNRQVRFFPCW